MTLAKSLNAAKRLERTDNLDDAAKIYGEILARYPKNINARKALESLSKRLRQSCDPSAAIQAQLTNGFAAGHFRVTATTAAELVRKHQDSFFLWFLLGRCYLQIGALDKSASCLTRACDIDPKSSDSQTQLGNARKQQHKYHDAIAHYTRAIELAPNDIAALNNLGNTLSTLGRFTEAAQYQGKARRLAPDNVQLQFNLANTLRQLGDLDAAKQLYATAAKTSPDFAAAHYNLGQVNGQQGNRIVAIANFDAALKVSPNDDRVRVQKLHQMAHVNDWRWLGEYQEHRRHLGFRGTTCTPFALLSMEDNPDFLRLRTQAYAEQKFRDIAPPLPARASQRPARLRVGYFSADFHAHATMHLMGGLFEHHDRSKFEILAYSYGPDQHDDSRKRLINNISIFREMHGASDTDFVAAAQTDKLDVAVDLKGYTGDNRSEIFANRLAPVQLSYLGYPGTMGTAAFDYLIGDHTVCPPGSERHYNEHLIRMPHSYQINDDKREISSRQFTRQDCGLPNDAFVFCCFNNSYKITPQEFDIWMRLLTQVEGSVLWLLRSNEWSQTNLRREAEMRGVDPDRLIFADHMPQQDHLARQKVADLFLDTFTYNAHTTGSDALWAGLPVLTLMGQQFAARVGASLLNAVGLPELITETKSNYEARALELATTPRLLLALRSKLQANRRHAPLFNTEAFARALEQGYDMAFDRHMKGLAPCHLNVPDLTAKTPNRTASKHTVAVA